MNEATVEFNAFQKVRVVFKDPNDNDVPLRGFDCWAVIENGIVVGHKSYDGTRDITLPEVHEAHALGTYLVGMNDDAQTWEQWNKEQQARKREERKQNEDRVRADEQARVELARKRQSEIEEAQHRSDLAAIEAKAKRDQELADLDHQVAVAERQAKIKAADK